MGGDNLDIKEISGYFKGVKWSGRNGFNALCPCHSDKRNSLSVTQKGDKILMKCFAGCNYSDILSSVGLSPVDIGVKKKTYEWKNRMAYGLNKNGGDYIFKREYKYTNANGGYLYSKVRFESESGGKKEIRYATIDDMGDTYKYIEVKNIKTLYKLPELLKTAADVPVYYCEGEKDVDTMRSLGFAATTAGGASDWRKEYARYFKGRRVIILQDNDKAGEKLREQVVRDLLQYTFKVTWLTTSEREHGDITDYINDGGSAESLKELVKAAEGKGNYKYAHYVFEDDNGKIKISPPLLAERISKNTNYIQASNPADNSEAIYVYDNGVYKQFNDNMIDSLISEYIPKYLRKVKDINDTRKFLLMERPKVISPSEINSDERYINFRNGLYNVSERRLIPHSPEIIFTTQLICNYEPENNHKPNFDRYIDDLCRTDGAVDESKKLLLQEWAGLLISNIPIYRVKKCLILYSSYGNTGKTQFVNILRHIIGESNISSIPMQNLSDRFSMGFLYGKRLNAVGDQQHADIGTSSLFKQLTGGDAVQCEIKGKQAFSFTYSGGMIFACNDLPSFTDDKGGHIFERMCIVPCNNIIPPEQRKGNMTELLIKEKSAIVNWAIDGLHRLIDNDYRFTECAEAAETNERYRSDVDSLHRYLTDNYFITGEDCDRILKTNFEADYSKWCSDNEINQIGKRNIKTRMEKNGIVIIKSNGERYYKGIKEITGFAI